MSRQKDREEFIALATKEGVPFSAAQKLMRYAATLHRLAERECNGTDWELGYPMGLTICPDAPPGAFNGRGVYVGPPTGGYCPTCGSSKDHGQIAKSQVEASRIERQVTALCQPLKIVPDFSGDPRGAVLKLQVPSGRTNDWGREGVCVP